MASKWVENVLLQDLFNKYQNRDKQYCEIIISSKQADSIATIMTQKTSFNEFTGTSRPIGKECYWNGRHVFLSHRGSYYFLSFGMNDSEKIKLANSHHEKEFQRQIDSAKKLVERFNNATEDKMTQYAERIGKRVSDLTAELDSAKCALSEGDNDAEDIEYYNEKIHECSMLLAILTNM